MALVSEQTKGLEELKPKPDILLKFQPIEASPKEGNLSPPEHLLAFYKFQYKTVEDLIIHDKQEHEGRLKAEQELAITKATLNAVQNRLQQTTAELQETKKQLEQAEDRNKAFFHYHNRTRGDIYLEDIIYGGTVIRNQEVIDRLLQLAADRKAFKVSNELLGGDTWVDVKKTFTAIYAVGGKGPFRSISQQENQVVKFE